MNRLLTGITLTLCIIVPESSSVMKPDMPAYVTRANYGVTYHYKHRVQVGTQLWYHTFVVSLETPGLLPYGSPQCARFNRLEVPQNVRRRLCYVARHYDLEKEHVAKTILEYKTTTNLLLPSVRNRTITKRGLVNFIGEIEKSLFGTATTADVNKVLKHVGQFENSINSLDNHFNKLEDDFSSLSKAELKRDKEFQKLAMIQTEKSDALLNYVNDTAQDVQSRLSDILISLHRYDIQEVLVLKNVKEVMEKELDSLHVLTNGYLPTYWVPPHNLEKTLTKISEASAALGPFDLVHKYIGDYYKLQAATFLRKGNHLFITLKIPISTHSMPLYAYQVNVRPLPIDHNNLHSTVLLHKSYFLISKTRQYFVEMSASELGLCSGTVIKHCPRELLLQKLSRPTCMSALFDGNNKLVKKLCEVVTVPPHLYDIPHAMSIADDGNVLLWTGNEKFVRTCVHGQHRFHENLKCKLCQLSLECQCFLESEHFVVEQNINLCRNRSTSSGHVLEKHALNLPALMLFLNTSNVEAIDPSFASSTKVLTDINKLNILQRNFSDVISNSRETSFSLNSIVKAIVKHKKIFATKADKLWHHFGYAGSQVVAQSTPILTYIALVLASLSFVLAVRLQYRVLAVTGVASAMDLRASQTGGQYDVESVSELDLDIHKLVQSVCSLMVLLTVVFFGTAAYCLYRRVSTIKARERNVSFHNVLYYTLYSCSEVFMIKLRYTVMKPDKMVLKEESSFIPPTHCGWGNLKFDWSFLKTSIRLPTTVSTPVWQSRKLSRVLAQLDAVKIMCLNGNDSYDIYVWSKHEIQPKGLVPSIYPTLEA